MLARPWEPCGATNCRASLQLGSLIDSYRSDMNVDVTLRIEGEPRTLPADTSLVLYRGAQEALTNIARYAPSASATVVLSYERDRTHGVGRQRSLGRPPQSGSAAATG